jgi:flagellar basal-body rod protein FlgC
MNDVQGTLAVSASALRAERLRLDVIASNLANATTTRTAEGGPYRRRNVVFVAQSFENDFATELENMAEEGLRRGVAVAEVVEDQAPFRQVFEPSHPDANAEGYVSYPNVNPVAEMVDLMAATRAYEANVQAVNATRKMADAALNIGG